MDLLCVHATERSLLSQRISAKENKQVEHAGRMMEADLFKVSEASCAPFLSRHIDPNVLLYIPHAVSWIRYSESHRSNEQFMASGNKWILLT
ncbi:unnamed protein product [Musa acuminata subsp. burmannicoides]